MSIGVNVTYRTPGREAVYRPYLTQGHLRDFLWPLAGFLGLLRIELLEVLSDYDVAENVRVLLAELEVLDRYLGDPHTDKRGYPHWEHVRNRTAELIVYLRETLAKWDEVREVVFF